MKIAINLLNFRPGLIGGAETVIRQIVANLPACAGKDEITIVGYPGNEKALGAESANVRIKIVPFGDKELTAWRILEAVTPLRCRKAEKAFEEIGADCVFFPQQSIFPRRARGAKIMLAVDVQHLIMPGNFPLTERAWRAASYGPSMKAADHIVAISGCTKNSLVELCDVPAEKISVVPLGAPENDVSGVVPYDAKVPFLYYPAATFPHKNHEALFRAMAVMKARGTLKHKLFLTGMRTPRWKKLSGLIAALGLSETVEHLGFVSRKTVDGLFKGCDAVVFPSLFEGFGIPVLEAAHFGKKIICSKLDVFREIGVPPSYQIDYADPDQLERALNGMTTSPLFVKPATWKETTMEIVRILRSFKRNAT